MTSTHTPGPWSIQRGNSHNPMVGTDAVSVAEVLDDVYPDVGQQEANARLIAACPTMLAICQRIAELTDGTFSDCDKLDNLDLIGDLARGVIRKAIQGT